MISSKLIAIGIGYMIGILAASCLLNTNTPVLNGLFKICAVLGFACGIFSVIMEYRLKKVSRHFKVLPLFIGAFCLANIITNNSLHPRSKSHAFFKSLGDKEPIALEGKIVAEPELRSENRLDIKLRANKVRKANSSDWTEIEPTDVLLSVSPPKDPCPERDIVAELSDIRAYGYIIEAQGIYTIAEKAKNPGAFDPEAFLAAEGFAAKVKVFDSMSYGSAKGSIRILEKTRGNYFIEMALASKRVFLKGIKDSIPPPESMFISGATFGTRFSIKGQTFGGKLIEDTFRHTGVGHVLAVSGLHVSVISLLLYSFFLFLKVPSFAPSPSGGRRIRLVSIPPQYFAPIVILLVFAFAFLTGARPSSLRAALMNSIVIFTYAYAGHGLAKGAYVGLAFSAFIILLSRPLVMFSPGFLLSFGAVFSLVFLTTPIDRMLKQMHGAVFIFAVIWFAAIIYFESAFWTIFLRWESIGICAAILFSMILIGSRLNAAFPFLTRFRYDRIPEYLRIFLSAQFGIMLGMTIPMSAYFFGSFAIAGSFVNLIAIPLIGIIVQLGIISGFCEYIPWVGDYLALVFGAANWIVAKLFLFSAWLGSEIFPFPPTPMPSLSWMIVYFAIVIVIGTSPLWFNRARTILYYSYSKRPFLVTYMLPSAILVALLSFSFMRIFETGATKAKIDILAGSAVPVICITDNDHRSGASAISFGKSFFSKSVLKSVMLKRGAIYMENSVATAHNPLYGTAGAAEFSASFIPLKNIFYPEFYKYNSEQGVPLFATQKDYFDALGDKKLEESAIAGKKWALGYYENFSKLSLCVQHDKSYWHFYKPPTEIKITDSISLKFLSKIYKDKPLIYKLICPGMTILVISDPSDSKAFQYLKKDEMSADWILLGGPNRMNSKYYISGMRALLKKLSPEKVIFTFDEDMGQLSLQKIAEDAVALCKESGSLQVIDTDKLGAATFTLSLDGKVPPVLNCYSFSF